MKGKIATSSLDGGSLQFLAHEHILWNKSYGDPRQLDQLRSKGKFSGKLGGKYSFSFSFPFPTEVNLLDKKSEISNTSIISPFLDSAHIPQILTSSSPTSALAQALQESNEKKSQLPDLQNAHGISSFSHPPMPSPEYKGKRQQASVSTSPSSTSRSGAKYSWNNFLPTNSPDKSSVLSSLHRAECLDVDSPASDSSMPQTFLEKGVSASVTYEFSIHFVHGRLKPSTK